MRMICGTARVVITSGAITRSVYDASSVRDAESETSTLNVKSPNSVGVPAREPSGARLTPSGKSPELFDHEYGGRPPSAVKDTEYGRAKRALGMVDVLTIGSRDAMKRLSIALAVVSSASFACTSKSKPPNAVDVPPSWPSADNVMPAGNEPLATDHSIGGTPPRAIRDCS